MHLPISPRLLACAGFVRPGERIADIGCDHGYLSIYLLQNGIVPSAIAADINEGPLQSARQNARKYGVLSRMTFHLSNGVSHVPRDFDALICAGMGADTMVSILDAAPWLKSKQYRLILQCQSKTPTLRRYLSENGWHIAREAVLRDGRFLYTVMEVLWQKDCPPASLGEFYFPKVLFDNPSAEVTAYYNWVVGGLKIATQHQQDNEKQEALRQLEALATKKEFSFLKEDTK